MELLIVDDEQSALQAVLQNVNWKLLPFGQIYTASNIERARLHLENSEIKVVLCDIEMPMGSGLDLLEWINENRQDVLCIFMTCHAEFGYAQQAIRLGSVDYILKPLDFDVLTRSLQLAADRVKKQAHQDSALAQAKIAVEQQFWRKLFTGDISLNRREIQEYVDKKNLNIFVEGRYVPIMVCFQLHEVNNTIEEKKLMLFAMKNICSELFLFPFADTQIESMADGHLLMIFALHEGEEEEHLIQAIQQQSTALMEAGKKYLQVESTCFIGHSSAIEAVPEQIETVYSVVYYTINHLWNHFNLAEQQIQPYVLISREAEYLKQVSKETAEPINKVIEYVHNHISDEIFVETLAEQVYLNSDYLNRIFKKKMGIPISTYIIEQKIEHAKYLLRGSDLSIGDIAAKVGYYNYSSFNRSFKKITGKSPQEWKLNH